MYLAMPSIPRDSDVLEWWRANQTRFPHVAKMTMQYLVTPASSATVERFFSAAGRAFSPLRQSMCPETLEAILWAKFNFEL